MAATPSEDVSSALYFDASSASSVEAHSLYARS